MSYKIVVLILGYALFLKAYSKTVKDTGKSLSEALIFETICNYKGRTWAEHVLPMVYPFSALVVFMIIP